MPDSLKANFCFYGLEIMTEIIFLTVLAVLRFITVTGKDMLTKYIPPDTSAHSQFLITPIFLQLMEQRFLV
jgi:hypothetical protein